MRTVLQLRSAAAAPTMAAWAALLALAGAALSLGLLVYLVDRPAGSAWLLPAQWHAPAGATLFGSAGAWLPSFVHTFAFSVLTAWLLSPRVGHAAWACFAWGAIDTLAECGQHPAVAPLLASAIDACFADSGLASIAAQVGRYFARGSFAFADLFAGLAGGAVAFVALRRVIRAGEAPRRAPRVAP